MQTWRESIHLAKEKLLDTLNENFISLPLSGEVETGSAGVLFQAYMSQKTQKQIIKILPDCQIKSELLKLIYGTHSKNCYQNLKW
jgi:hypothetical protein